MNAPGSALSRLARRPWLLAAVLLALLAAWLLSGLLVPHPREVDQPAPAARVAPPTPVQVARLVAEPIERTVTLSGRTAPARTVELKAETSGRVVAVGAARGSRVESRALLLRLDAGDRVARLAQARAELRQRELEYDGQTRLKPQGYISDARLAESLAQLEKARAEVKRAELDVERMQLRAPFAGALQDRLVEVGDYVSPGTPVATFVDDRRLAVAGSVAEGQASLVRAGLAGTAHLASGQVVPGRLRYVAPVADEATRTFAVELEIPNPRGELPVGVTADIELPVGRVSAHRLSPALLTLDDAGVVGVKIQAAGDRVKFVPATVVRTAPDGVWITGLPDPAPVIVGGQGFVRDGDRVAVTLAPAEASPAVASSAVPEARP
ncbi:MAG: efflux RND transporter periplasmic adaptor subunit [Steroidobacteraceae bacterium]|jgi:multidrug efflux system membrane fusion protein|nr:efflux RND transporter periplasmic adaptor subunit [Steroidobacteraceae bacterium]